MRKWMTLFFAVALMLMILASARGEMVSVTELREQVGTMGRWTADYTDRYDRKIHIDIEPIMGQYGAMPIILAKKVKWRRIGLDSPPCLCYTMGRSATVLQIHRKATFR